MATIKSGVTQFANCVSPKNIKKLVVVSTKWEAVEQTGLGYALAARTYSMEMGEPGGDKVRGPTDILYRTGSLVIAINHYSSIFGTLYSIPHKNQNIDYRNCCLALT